MCLCPGSGLKQLLERWVTASSGMALVFAGVERPFSFYEERLLCFLRPLPDQPNGAGARSAAASCRGQAPLDLRLFRVDRRASAAGFGAGLSPAIQHLDGRTSVEDISRIGRPDARKALAWTCWSTQQDTASSQAKAAVCRPTRLIPFYPTE